VARRVAEKEVGQDGEMNKRASDGHAQSAHILSTQSMMDLCINPRLFVNVMPRVAHNSYELCFELQR
jgi:hypothetical protein